MTMIEEYISFRAIIENDELDDSNFCTKLGISLADLESAKRAEPEWAKRSLDKRRELYAKETKQVDDALLKKAREGNTKAAELWYRRFDGWSPKIVESETHNYYNFADLARKLSERDRGQTGDSACQDVSERPGTLHEGDPGGESLGEAAEDC
jgi:hypothetical protein